MTKEPRWLLRETLLAMQAGSVHEHGGLAGLRDAGLLDSALARPAHLLGYGAPDLFELAAAYAGGIVRNHPFLDGNKRAAFLAAFVFLADNGRTLAASEADVVRHVRALAAREESEEDFAEWLRTVARPQRRRRPRKKA